MSLDAYRHQTGGSITIAVTGTDNPVPSTEGGDFMRTPSGSVPAVSGERAGSEARTQVSGKVRP